MTLTNANLLTAYFTTPAVSTDTVLTFTLTAVDNLGASGSATTHVTVHHVNEPPTANAGPAQTVNENTQVTLSGASFDPDGSIVRTRGSTTDGPPGGAGECDGGGDVHLAAGRLPATLTSI